MSGAAPGRRAAAVTRGNLFIISAPSGAGKTTLARGLNEALPNTAFSISHTTRPQRRNETHGVDYYFVSEREFLEMVDRGEFLEYARVFGNWYGTSKAAVRELMEQGKTVLLDIDWQGARCVRQQMPGSGSIFILPPSMEELERRLRSRGQDSEEIIQQRMQKARDEIQHAEEYDYVVVNDDFERALRELCAIVSGEHSTTATGQSH
ncbi:MAG TPA: guanylate kinase [Arenicellales bacterium]|nr:guanylate kinase [Arenicellales bacterium]